MPIKKVTALISSAITYLSVTVSVHAATQPLLKDPSKISNEVKVESIPQLLITYTFYLAGFLAVLYLMFGGIKLITSRGDKQAVESARRHITYSIIGVVIVIGSFFILNVLFNILGAENPLKKGFCLPTLSKPQGC